MVLRALHIWRRTLSIRLILDSGPKTSGIKGTVRLKLSVKQINCKGKDEGYFIYDKAIKLF